MSLLPAGPHYPLTVEMLKEAFAAFGVTPESHRPDPLFEITTPLSWHLAPRVWSHAPLVSPVIARPGLSVVVGNLDDSDPFYNPLYERRLKAKKRKARRHRIHVSRAVRRWQDLSERYYKTMSYCMTAPDGKKMAAAVRRGKRLSRLLQAAGAQLGQL